LKEGKKAVNGQRKSPEVGIVMGSDSDLEIMEEAAFVLKQFDIPFEMTIASARNKSYYCRGRACCASGRNHGSFYVNSCHWSSHRFVLP